MPTNPIVPIFVTMLVVMFLIGVVLVWHNRDAIVKGIKKLIRKNDVGQLDLDFEEDIERVFSLKDLLKKRRRSVRDFLNRLLKRPERIEDMPDNRMKVRFTYHALLKKLGASKSGTPIPRWRFVNGWARRVSESLALITAMSDTAKPAAFRMRLRTVRKPH